MFETLLHVGHGHPNLLWVLVPSYIAFLLGLGVGLYSDRIREFASRADPVEN